VVGSRCHRGRDGRAELNAHRYDAAGRLTERFCLGDGIEHLAVDGAGTFWVGYFDEGVFGDNGWTQPIGAAGLVQFTEHGQPLYRYTPPSGADAIVDTYALNVDAHTVWTYYHSDFPLVRIKDHHARAYATPVRGARAIIIHDRDVVFVGDYDDPLRLSGCHLTDTQVEYRGQAQLIQPDGTLLNLYRIVAAHGSRLHIRTDAHIAVADLADEHDHQR
jgi:hypothetical protein